MKKKAFTLIELLVVIAIIALLLSILMPALQATKFRARVLLCKSGFHQWGLVTQIYATSNNGRYPSFDLGGTGGNTWDVANEFVEVMMKDTELVPKLFFCPVSASKEDKMSMGGIDTAIAHIRLPYDWFSILDYNWWVPRKNGGNWVPTDPSKSDSYPDRDTHRNNSFKPLMSDILGVPKTSGAAPDDLLGEGNVRGGHQKNEKLNSTSVLFGDGHAETRKPKEIKLRYDRGNWLNYY
jgi:prepilin-type N-terminal cleavage/methylation domain-containing protein